MDDIVAEIIGTSIPKLLDFKISRNGELILARRLSDNDGDIIELNEDATRTLSLCDGRNDINAITKAIVQQHKDAEFKTVRNDIIKLICSLEGAKIITTNY
ncbi:hypothetical protein FACS1894122_08320 [Alphaproteobacteria bacterium]|nr:hypothetical protein FACS1894122_08320 [Alphaproteobacteria bacterium]